MSADLKHYAGDDSDVKVLMGGLLQAFAGQTVDEYAAGAADFLAEASPSEPRPAAPQMLVRADGRAPAAR